MPLVSLLTCTFNHEQFIGRNIDSIRTQTFEDWEHIVLNDASSDKTKEMIMEKKRSRLKYLESKVSRGPFRLAEVYDEALNACSGKYVAFLDGDDYALPSARATCREWVKQTHHPDKVVDVHLQVANEVLA